MYYKSNNFESEFKNWYVIQVRSGREHLIKNFTYRLLNNRIKLIIFSREVIHTKNSKDIKLILPLFPGYIFIKEKINTVVNILKSNLNYEFVKPIKFSNQPAKVSTDEMKLLLQNSDHEGKIPLSYGFKNGDSIIITKGPLKNLQGKVLFINEKKKKAKVSLNLFNRSITVSLGIELINKKKINNNY